MKQGEEKNEETKGEGEEKREEERKKKKNQQPIDHHQLTRAQHKKTALHTERDRDNTEKAKQPPGQLLGRMTEHSKTVKQRRDETDMQQQVEEEGEREKRKRGKAEKTRKGHNQHRT